MSAPTLNVPISETLVLQAREAAAREHITEAEYIEKALARQLALEILRQQRTRQNALSDDEAMRIATDELRAHRAERAAKSTR
jgi:hypothetical protein